VTPTTATDMVTPAATPGLMGGGRAKIVVGLLMTAYALSFVDRQILNLLAQSIKTDLDLTDVQLSYLQGICFALFYTLFGIPLGIAADRWRRTRIIATGVLLWSVMTSACGLAQNFAPLALARVGVGVGEAALGPSAVSLISDSFSPASRPRALSIFNLGTAIGGAFAYFGGALIIPRHDIVLPLLGVVKPWQATFLMLGVPGIILSAVLSRVSEPRRQGLIGLKNTAAAIPLRETIAFVRAHGRAYGAFFAALTMLALITYGAGSQTAIFFIRTFGWTARQTGVTYGLMSLFCAVPATILAGWLAARQRRLGRPEGTFRTIAWAATGLIAPATLAWIMPGPYWALAVLAGQNFGLAMGMNIATAAVADITPNQFRGQLVAAYLFTITIVGLGLGPTMVALLTEKVFQDEHAVRYSLVVFDAIVAPLAAIFMWVGMPAFKRAAAEARSWTGVTA
jgi:MFS family permease